MANCRQMTAFEEVTLLLDQASERLELADGLREMLRRSWRELQVQVPVRMDDGRIEVFTGYRVQHNGARGPYKGGVRFHPDADLDEVRALAALMTWKTALAGLPYGGAKGSVQCDPNQLSEGELNRLTRRYTLNIEHLIGPNRDIPAPDMGTSAQTMAWMMDAYGQLHGYMPGIVTGKPVELGGSLGRDAATGRGLSYLLMEAANDLDLDPRGARVVIQGFGNVGSWAALLLSEYGCRVIGVSGIRGGVYNPNGLDIPGLLDHYKAARAVPGFTGGENISNVELLELECDVLVPAAIGNVITAQNAPRIQARIIVEAANHPTTPEADEILSDRGVTVLPDILANAGGVIVSYFEWAQNIQRFHWEEDRVNEELHKTMVRAYHEVHDRAVTESLTYRQSAFDIGVQRVAHAVELRGFL